jgi:hypothetical protein
VERGRILLAVTGAAKTVLELALALSEEERRTVAHALLDGMPPEEASEFEAAWLEEARRRAGRVERGEVHALDGDTALAALEQRIRSIRGT